MIIRMLCLWKCFIITLYDDKHVVFVEVFYCNTLLIRNILCLWKCFFVNLYDNKRTVFVKVFYYNYLWNLKEYKRFHERVKTETTFI